MAQPNHLALLLVMAMASLAYLNICSKVLGTWVSMLLFVLLATGLAMTESRAGLLQVWVLAALFYLRPPAAEARFSKEPRLLRWHGLTGAAFATALFIVYPAIFGLLTGADVMASRMAEGSTRFLVWPQLAEAIMLKPWFGWGMLQVGPAHNAVAHAHPIAEAFHYSHNIFIDLAIWAGLHIAVCLTALAAIWLLRHLVKTQTVRTLYTLALLLALGVASTLEYQYAYAYFLAPAAFAIGVLERVHDAKVWHFASVRVTLAAAVTVTGLMAWSAIEYFALEEDFRVVRFQTSRIGSTPQGYEVPTTVLLTQLSALANNSRIKITPTMTPEQLTALRNSALRYPWTATQSRYALALALNGNLAEGQRQLHVMRAQHGKPIFLRVVDELNLRLGENNSLSKFTRD